MDLFPTLPGLTFDGAKTPEFANIQQRADSLNDMRIALAVYPLWTFNLSFALLRDDYSTMSPSSPNDELKTLLGFFLRQNGSLRAFLYSDTSDNNVVAQQFGTGDASTVAFQLIRTYGAGGFGFSEPVQNLNGAPVIFRNDWQLNQQLYATARTNKAPHSQTLGSWTAAAITVTDNAATGPDGTSDATHLVETATTAVHNVSESAIAVTAATSYTASVWLKKSGRTLAQVSIDDGSGNGSYVDVDMNAGTITAHGVGGTGTYVGSSITAYPSGWYRVTLTGQIATTSARVSISSINSNSATLLPSFAGNTGNDFYAFGFQFELGTAATSYIATVATAVSLTDYTVSATGLVTFAVAPLAAAVLTWTGAYYYRCRFVDDTYDFNEIVYQLWELKKLTFVGSIANKV